MQANLQRSTCDWDPLYALGADDGSTCGYGGSNKCGGNGGGAQAIAGKGGDGGDGADGGKGGDGCPPQGPKSGGFYGIHGGPGPGGVASATAGAAGTGSNGDGDQYSTSEHVNNYPEPANGVDGSYGDPGEPIHLFCVEV